MKNNKNLLIAIAVVCIVIILAAGAFFILKKGTKQQSGVVAQQNQVISTLNPSDIGLKLSLIQSGKFAQHGIEMDITKISDITSVDYELDYTSQGGIPRGAIGHIDVKPTDSQITQQLPFGTCSDVCHFDQGISGVKLTLKITKKDGSAYQVVSPFSF